MSVTQIRPNVWVGSWESARDVAFLTANKITSILNVACDCDDPDMVDTIKRFRIPMIDGPGNPDWVVMAAWEFATCLIKAGENVLIHCVAGHSRSVYVAAKALARLEDRPYDAVWQEIYKLRPEITNPQRLKPLYG